MDQQTAQQLLLDCLRTEAKERENVWMGGLTFSDWEIILQQANKHKLAPLLYHKLHTLRINLPADISQRLQFVYLQSAARNTYIYHKLSEVLDVLQKEGIPCIVLKGAHLAETMYESIALRPMADIDLLVRPEDLAKTQQYLIKTGHLALNSDLPLDIHWSIERLLIQVHRNMNTVWKRAQPARIAGSEALALAPEDLLVHLCLHLSVHHLFQGRGLRSLWDIRATIAYYSCQLKWEQITNTVNEWGICAPLYLTLVLAKELVGARIPDDVLEDLKPQSLEPPIKQWALQQIFQKPAEMFSLSPCFWQLWMPGSAGKKVVTFRKLLFPPPKVVSQAYPSSFGSIRNYFYYLVRLKDHILPYTRALWHIFTHDEDMIALLQQQQRNLAMGEWLVSEIHTQRKKVFDFQHKT